MDDAPHTPLRIGTLGAARITPTALVRPARLVAGAELFAVAARDPREAEKFARRHRVPRVHQSYEDLLADPEVEAVYVPLPNGLHCEWTTRALEAGKHVLCEKPLAANETEAQRMADAAAASGRVLAEAFHWRYHPLAARMRDIVRGTIGELRHVEAHMCVPLPIPGDIRYRLDLAGGAMMDVGCYALSLVRFLADAEPEVLSAEARLSSPGVDRFMKAELRFPGGVTGRITCSLFSSQLLKIQALARGESGEMQVTNPVAPHLFHRLRVRTSRNTMHERIDGEATYTHQLRAFVRWVREGVPMPTDAAHGVANMRAIDAIYDRAGMSRRGRA